MHIRHMRVGMSRGFMAMRVAVWPKGHGVVRMQVVPISLFGVVAMAMFMLQHFMRVRVAV